MLEIIKNVKNSFQRSTDICKRLKKNAKGFISMQIVTKIRILMKNCSITIELQQNPEN